MKNAGYILLLLCSLLGATAARAQSIIGPSTLCIGHPDNFFGSPGGGTWSSSATVVGTINPVTGIGVGLTAGTVTFTYTLPSSAFATINVTVATPPTPGTISGSSTVCLGGTTTLSGTASGATWSTSNPAVGVVSSTGVVTGVSLGTTTVSHTVVSGSCYAAATHTITVVAGTTLSSLSSLCVGSSTTITPGASGGTWSSATPAIGTVSSAGVVTGISPGIAYISYTLPSGCMAGTALSVNPNPSPLTGITTICIGSTTTLSSSPSGGIWTTSGGAISMSPTTALITGVSAGTASVSYSVLGCRAITTINVLPGSVSVTAGGPAGICVGGTVALTGTPAGGTWSSSSPAGTVSASGVVTGVFAGTTMVTYATGTGCFATTPITVGATPAAISGPSSLCDGTSITLTNSVPGGTWTSSAPVFASVSTSGGIVTGIASGTAIITYATASGCYVTHTVTVLPFASISGSMTFCAGGSTTLTGSPSGGTWSAVGGSVSTGGVVSGTTSGVAIVTYVSAAGCSATAAVSINPVPSSIGGTLSYCAGSGGTLTSATAGGIWSSSATAVGTIDVASGIVAALTPGTSTIAYTLPTGCASTAVLTVTAIPAVTASSAAASCGPSYTLSASGAATYTWSPATGLSCTACASPVTTPAASATYTVTGTTAGCSSTAVVTVSMDRIHGHVLFSSTAPSTPAVQVWLIQYNPTDSSIVATDSVTSCTDAGTEYYSFDSKPAGNYLVKAKLLSATPGASDYIPTYGSSTPSWYLAASIAHAAGVVDVQDINMIYGTVPSGPGFISGYVYAGAGKGTAAGDPIPGMLVYLRNTAGDVLTYTYTNASGAFSFSSLALGSYVIYPEEQTFYTTPSDVITLSASSVSYTSANFRQYPVARIIMPAAPTRLLNGVGVSSVGVFPNPARSIAYVQVDRKVAGSTNVVVTDITGRTILSTQIETNEAGIGQFNISTLVPGSYMVRVLSASGSFITHLVKE